MVPYSHRTWPPQEDGDRHRLRADLLDGLDDAGRPVRAPKLATFEIAFESAVGLFGTIYAKDLTFELHPTETEANG